MVEREPRYETYARCCTREQRPHSKPAIITNEQCVALGTVGLIRSLQNSIFVAILGALNPYGGKVSDLTGGQSHIRLRHSDREPRRCQF